MTSAFNPKAELAAGSPATHPGTMEVAIIFDLAFHGETGQAVWIIDTPSNRKWFEEQHGLDPNSAVFSIQQYSDVDTAIVETIWNVQEHHPSWDRLSVFRATLTPMLRVILQREGQISETLAGFSLVRA